MARIYIKNMVCPRCVTAVESVLKDTGLHPKNVELGFADLENDPEKVQLKSLDQKLSAQGFERIHDAGSKLSESVKKLLIEYVEKLDEDLSQPNISEYLSSNLYKNYNYISQRFSEIEEITIEEYLIRLKIERVKELLQQQELKLSEIAWKLGYSSPQYLSNQFKKITGVTPTDWVRNMQSIASPRTGREI